MPAYEAGDFEPPAPVVRAIVRGPGGTAYEDVPLLIDTGADVSVIPLDVVDAIGARIAPSSASVQFLMGEPINCNQADLTVEFLRYRFHGPFLLVESSYGILGRNVLNLLLVTLDGPSQVWSA